MAKGVVRNCSTFFSFLSILSIVCSIDRFLTIPHHLHILFFVLIQYSCIVAGLLFAEEDMLWLSDRIRLFMGCRLACLWQGLLLEQRLASGGQTFYTGKSFVICLLFICRFSRQAFQAVSSCLYVACVSLFFF